MLMEEDRRAADSDSQGLGHSTGEGTGMSTDDPESIETHRLKADPRVPKLRIAALRAGNSGRRDSIDPGRSDDASVRATRSGIFDASAFRRVSRKFSVSRHTASHNTSQNSPPSTPQAGALVTPRDGGGDASARSAGVVSPKRRDALMLQERIVGIEPPSPAPAAGQQSPNWAAQGSPLRTGQRSPSGREGTPPRGVKRSQARRAPLSTPALVPLGPLCHHVPAGRGASAHASTPSPLPSIHPSLLLRRACWRAPRSRRGPKTSTSREASARDPPSGAARCVFLLFPRLPLVGPCLHVSALSLRRAMRMRRDGY